MLAILLTIFGIGFLLFIHELGHFLAARAAGVRVEVFALGMGPRLFGFRRGDTDYRIAALPIGGYVQMAGEHSGDRSAPDSLQAKSIPARFLIFSGGILMNFAFALIMIPLLFRIGVPMQAPVAGSVEPGSPAWQAGIEPGARFLQLDRSRTHSFADFASTVALSDPDASIQVHYRSVDGQPASVRVAAERDPRNGLPRLGVGPMPSFALASESPATEAGLPAGGKLRAIAGVELLGDPALAQAILAETMLAGRPLAVQLAGAREGRIVPRAVPGEQPQLGVYEAQSAVLGLRDGHRTGLLEGDVVLRAGGRSVRAIDTLLLAAHEGGGLPELEILRGQERLQLPAVPGLTPRHLAAHLHLGPDPEAVRIIVRPGGAADEAGLADGDRILSVGTTELSSFIMLRNALAAAEGGALNLQVLRADGAHPVAVQPRALPGYDYGLIADLERETVRETNILAAVSTGLVQARTMVRQVFLSFQRIVTGAIPASNLGGIITISRTGHHFATNGIIPFLFFLCMISIHLGVLNLLPIPALDGGHLFFLFVEAIRGRPVSERVLLWFNFSGFVLIMGLVIFVTILDIGRLVP